MPEIEHHVSDEIHDVFMRSGGCLELGGRSKDYDIAKQAAYEAQLLMVLAWSLVYKAFPDIDPRQTYIYDPQTKTVSLKE